MDIHNSPESDLFAGLETSLSEAKALVSEAVAGLGTIERDRASQFVIAALDLAVEMWFQKGDPSAPAFTNWEYPWRKYGGDNPTTSYLSAPVAPGQVYRLVGEVGDATYAGVQLYTRGPGYNAPSASISDTALVDASGRVDLMIGGDDPGNGRPWVPLADGDYLLMVRLYYTAPPTGSPAFGLQRVGGSEIAPLSTAERMEAAVAFFREEVLSSMAVTEALRAAGVNGYPPPDAPVHRPKYTGALFPTLDNAYDGFYVDLAPGQFLRLRGELPVARYSSFVFYDRWFNTPDYPRHRCYRTGDEMVLDADGRYEMIIGPDDPGHPNWLDTGGLREGIFSVRCLLPEQKKLPSVEIVDP